jgi:hypothetical protein
MLSASAMKIFIAIVIFIFITLSSAYFLYCNLTEVNLPANDLSFEAPDQNDSQADQQKEFGQTLPNVLSVPFLSRINVPEVFTNFSWQVLFFQQEPFLLRC